MRCPTRIDEGIGLERLCSNCKEWWPSDTEFFYRNDKGLRGWCKACDAEHQRHKRQGQRGQEG